MASDQAQIFCHVIDDILVADSRLAFGWAEGFRELASAAEHTHYHTTIRNAAILPEGRGMMAHVKKAEPWEEGKSTVVPEEAQVRPASGGGLLDPFFASVYVDDFYW